MALELYLSGSVNDIDLDTAIDFDMIEEHSKNLIIKLSQISLVPSKTNLVTVPESPQVLPFDQLGRPAEEKHPRSLCAKYHQRHGRVQLLARLHKHDSCRQSWHHSTQRRKCL